MVKVCLCKHVANLQRGSRRDWKEEKYVNRPVDNLCAKCSIKFLPSMTNVLKTCRVSNLENSMTTWWVNMKQTKEKKKEGRSEGNKGIPINYIQAHLLFPQWQCSKSPITISIAINYDQCAYDKSQYIQTIQQSEAMIGKPIIKSCTLLKTHTMGYSPTTPIFGGTWGALPQHRKPRYASIPQNRSMLCHAPPL
jgi:hypothetical protein